MQTGLDSQTSISMWKYVEYLPVQDSRFIATLGEGNTALVPSTRIGPALGLARLYFKLETQNPTGSYKDRFASVAASLMLQQGKRKIVAASSGNTGSAMAAYAARFGLEMELFVLEDSAEEKLVQASAFGAKVFRVKGLGQSLETEDQLMCQLQARSESRDAVCLVSAVCTNPLEMEGVKTIAHEICEQMEGPPDHVFIPVGAGGLFLTCFKGFRESLDKWSSRQMPHLHAVQPEGCATVVGPLSRGETRARPLNCTTKISGLQVNGVYDGQEVLEKVVLTGGSGQMPSDDCIYYWQRRLIREEGIYTEPAGAAALAGLAIALKQGLVQANEKIVCLVTGSGFKDLRSIQRILANTEFPLIDVGDI